MSPPVILALLLALAAAVRLRRAGRARRARDRRRTAELELLRALSAELIAGAPPLAAWRAVVDELGRGDTSSGDKRPADADAQLLRRAASCESDGRAAEVLSASTSAGVRAVGTAWRVSAATGAPLALSLDRMAGAAADAAATARTVRATLAGPRMTARLLALLPVVGLALAALSGTDPLAVLLGTPPGRLCLVVGVLLDVAGLLWIERLANAAEP